MPGEPGSEFAMAPLSVSALLGDVHVAPPLTASFAAVEASVKPVLANLTTYDGSGMPTSKLGSAQLLPEVTAWLALRDDATRSREFATSETP